MKEFPNEKKNCYRCSASKFEVYGGILVMTCPRHLGCIRSPYAKTKCKHFTRIDWRDAVYEDKKEDYRLLNIQTRIHAAREMREE